MPRKRKSERPLNPREKVVRIENYRLEIERMKNDEQGENFKPKTIRKIIQIEKKIQKIA
jgi:hypothetical protein